MKVTVIPEGNWKELTDEELGGNRGENSVCISRYGGFGDVIQSSSMYPLLKKQGKTVCVNVTETGLDLLKDDPNIDELLVQKDEQIPNDELGPYWDRVGTLFSDFINSNGTVEANLLAVPGKNESFDWDHDKRHAALNKNYSEALHDKASLPHIFNCKFYPTALERKWVAKQRKRMRIKSNHYVIAVTLSGSAVHKAYPYMDAVMAKLLMMWPNVKLITMGDHFCKLLEAGWENEKRVYLRSGKWSIRKSLAFSQQADMVIGPETGVLNALSMESVPKICLLSHSSHENLTKHWINNISLEPNGVDCFPCHKMHINGFKTCNRDEETGASMCAARIDPRIVIDSIKKQRVSYRKSA